MSADKPKRNAKADLKCRYFISRVMHYMGKSLVLNDYRKAHDIYHEAYRRWEDRNDDTDYTQQEIHFLENTFHNWHDYLAAKDYQGNRNVKPFF